MNVSQRSGAGLMILAGLTVPGLVARRLVVGMSHANLTLLAALGLAGRAGYALGQGASSLR